MITEPFDDVHEAVCLRVGFVDGMCVVGVAQQPASTEA